MRVLLIGSGGREHALAWSLSASPLLTKLFAAPGNPGICALAECVAIDVGDPAAIVAFCRAERIDLVVVGPEAPLVAGLVDDLAAAGIRTFGPNRAAAALEGSKRFTKELCREAGIPTAAYAAFSDRDEALVYMATQPLPLVVKADGLAAGKGVVIATTHEEAVRAVTDMFAGSFGAAGTSVVIEEFLEGEEASFFALSDGKHVIPFGTAQDHKRAFDGDKGPNTGGMGAYSPAPIMTDAMMDRAMREIVAPTVATLARRGIAYCGVLYAGLMLTADGPKLIEYNCRFGDPECQVLMLRLRDDLLTILSAAVDGVLDRISVRWSDDAALAVVIAARGYPGDYPKGTLIKGLEKAAEIPDTTIFHAGTALDAGHLVANGGRVLNVCGRGMDIAAARAAAYGAVDRIDWPEGFCRRDIGWRALS